MMKSKISIITVFMVLLILSACGASESPKQNKFVDVERIANEEQINLHFMWKNKELKDNNIFTVVLLERSENSPDYAVEPTVVVINGKLGLKVAVNGNKWSIQNLYFPKSQIEFSPVEGSPNYELYLNASWKLEPLLDDYCIYLDDYVIDNVEDDYSAVHSSDIFNLIDMTTGTEFVYSLELIYDDTALSGR